MDLLNIVFHHYREVGLTHIQDGYYNLYLIFGFRPLLIKIYMLSKIMICINYQSKVMKNMEKSATRAGLRTEFSGPVPEYGLTGPTELTNWDPVPFGILKICLRFSMNFDCLINLSMCSKIALLLPEPREARKN